MSHRSGKVAVGFTATLFIVVVVVAFGASGKHCRGHYRGGGTCSSICPAKSDVPGEPGVSHR